MSSLLNNFQLKNFDEIWVPDFKNESNLSGKLGHLPKKSKFKIRYLGPLSKLNKTKSEKKHDIMVLLSGPEPQRSIIETILFKELDTFSGSILFVKRKIESKQTKISKNKFTIYNYMTTHELEKAINNSSIIISRSGYTTVMDLAKLEKTAFFIPTPGQFEQEYLAKRLSDLKLAPFCNQDEFNINELEKIENFKGLNMEYKTPDLEVLFHLF
ncbi:glycosyltransferase [Lacinutrix sp.]|uniref:glycosyltransferase n=1 Tax=Lacinutrix sp. TaxID=1937692 RepID=UPI0030ED1E4B